MIAAAVPPQISGNPFFGRQFFGSQGALYSVFRIGASVLAGALVLVAMALVALAAFSVALLIAVAALALSLAPRAKRRGPEMLEGRRTADGWVIELGAR